ncbi:amino acid ABC transporter permease [Ostreiculturibacter nitratireducens]|uniref:amino acid ABC transporter permease n=1 Tax=Ostreiculturibacter nitratireducens TaxID=3075226 RepID=UPI003CCC503F
MIAEQPAPASEAGVVKWLRENLFSGPVNTILTLIGLTVIYYMVSSAWPWFRHSVWNASSLHECKEIVTSNYGEGAVGACWAMLRERWHQFLFGFYPPEEYWRPTFAFGLLFVALAPVLYFGNRKTCSVVVGTVAVLLLVYFLPHEGHPVAKFVAAASLAALGALAWFAPKRLLWFTPLYPALTFWLLWGGSVWTPVFALAGVAVGVLAYRLAGSLGTVMATSIGFLATVLWWLFLSGSVAAQVNGLLPIGLEHVDSDRFGGFLLAVVIGVTAISGSLPLGILLALGRRSDMFLIKSLCVGFIEAIRGVPLITLLFTASLLLNYFLPPGTTFDIILRVIIMVTIFAAAYLAEVVRGGLAALPRGQYEAADALGLDYWKAQRLIVMPQALKISIPGIVSVFIGLFKDTTLVSLVGLMDPLRGVTQVVRSDIAWKGIYWEPYIFVGAIFFAFCFGMSRYSMYLEQKLKREHR